MFENFKKHLDERRAEAQHRKEEQERLAQEEQERAVAEKAAQIAEEKAKIQAEHDHLMGMTEKELLVEAVVALRGLYSKTERLETELSQLGIDLTAIADDLVRLKRRVRDLENSLSD